MQKQLIKHEETNQWPATVNSSEDISAPGHSPIINSVIFKHWSKYYAYAMVFAKNIIKVCLKHGRLILQYSGPRIPVF